MREKLWNAIAFVIAVLILYGMIAAVFGWAVGGIMWAGLLILWGATTYLTRPSV